jgi:hypothetical protein
MEKQLRDREQDYQVADGDAGWVGLIWDGHGRMLLLRAWGDGVDGSHPYTQLTAL